MAFDPDELATLTDHVSMKLRSAVSRAMLLPKELTRLTIVRGSEPTLLNFKEIRVLAAAQYNKQVVAID